MKKYIAVLSVILGLMVQQTAFSASNSCSSKPYPVSNVLSRGLQGITGLNFIVPKIAESKIESELRKTTKGNINVTLKPYSAFDLAAGKLKGFKFEGKNMVFDDVHITSLEAESLCDFVYINYKTEPITPLAPLYMNIKGSISEDDFNRTFSSKRYREDLSKVKMKLYNSDITLLDIMDSRIKIDGNRLSLTSNIHFSWLPKFMTVPVKLNTGLKVVNNKIKFTDVKVLTGDAGIDLTPLAGLFDIFNPTILDISTLETNGSKIKIKDVNIKDNKVNIEGTVLLPTNFKA